MTKTIFRTSVNISYDIGDKSIIKSYLPTPSHADAIIGFTNGFLNDSDNSSHIMIGPYGSGKSMLATILASIVSKDLKKNDSDFLLEKFSNVHEDVYSNIKDLKNLQLEYIPVILSGSYNDFGESIVNSINDELIKRGIIVDFSTVKNQILQIINTWSKDFKDTYESFIRFVDKKYKSFSELEKLLNLNDRETINWFKDIYSQLTSGAEFKSNSGEEFKNNLSDLLEVLKKEKIGIFLVHDEFGRLLQNATPGKIHKLMQDLQDLAEIVNRSDNYLQLILISHKNMSQYMQGYNRDYKSEFERIEKRFNSYYIESDSSTYYRIVEHFIRERSTKRLPINQDVSKLKNKLRYFNLYEELNDHEIEKIILEGSFPLHPLTLYLLPRVSKVFGQNERTLFTYLTSHEKEGLLNNIENDNYILPSELLNYFIKDLVISNTLDEDVKLIVDNYKRIKNNLDLRKRNAYKVINFVALWTITNSNIVSNLSSELIAFATEIEEKKLQEILDELVSSKFLRYNFINEHWELAQGSSLIIEELINENKPKVRINESKRIELINTLLPKKYYLARDYNEEKNMTRFMQVRIISSNQYLNENYKTYHNNDGSIYLIALNNYSDNNKVIASLERDKTDNYLYAVSNNELSVIQSHLDSYLVINELLTDVKLLSQYEFLKEELLVYKEYLEYEINIFIGEFFKFENVKWVYQGKEQYFRSELEIENFISSIMFTKYPDTPIIVHDAINRFNVQGIQKRSMYELVDLLLNNVSEINLGIEGQGPTYLLYATIIKNNEIDFHNLDSIKVVEFYNLRQDLLNLFEKQKRGRLSDIVSLLSQRPYGIRPFLIPIYTVMLLRDHWKQIMFYHKDMFVPALEGEKIYDMFALAEEYSYVYHDYSTEEVQFMNNLENEFKSYISEYVYNEPQLIRVSSGLLSWLRHLPKQTQLTNHTKDTLNQLKEHIRRSEINPLSSIDSIMDLCKNKFKNLIDLKNELEQSHKIFKKKIKTYTLQTLEMSNFNNKSLILEKYSESEIVSSYLLNALNLSNDIEEFYFKYLGTEISDWSDINTSLYKEKLENDIAELKNDQVSEKESETLYINGNLVNIESVDLSKKSDIIYNNVERMIKNAGRTVSDKEINYILFKLMSQYLK